MKAALFFCLLFITQIGRSQDFHFFFDVGDCNPRYRPSHLIADSTESLMVDWYSGNYVPDSVRVNFLDTSFVLDHPWRFSIPKLPTGTIELSATFYRGNDQAGIDTVFAVSLIPKVYSVIKKIESKPGKFQFEIQTYDSNNFSEVSNKYAVCFAEYDIIDSSGNVKYSAGGGRKFNLSYLEQDSSITLQKGDQLHLQWVRLFSKDIGRSFSVYSNTKVNLFQSDSIKKEFFDNGQLFYEVPMQNGVQNGWYIQYYQTGQVFCRLYKVNGLVKDGTYYEFHKNGKIYRECHYRNGLEHGVFMAYDSNGNPWKQYIFKKGKWVGLKVWNEEKGKWEKSGLY